MSYYNVQGVWRKGKAEKVNINGVWKNKKSKYSNVQGVWKKEKKNIIFVDIVNPWICSYGSSFKESWGYPTDATGAGYMFRTNWKTNSNKLGTGGMTTYGGSGIRMNLGYLANLKGKTQITWNGWRVRAPGDASRSSVRMCLIKPSDVGVITDQHKVGIDGTGQNLTGFSTKANLTGNELESIILSATDVTLQSFTTLISDLLNTNSVTEDDLGNICLGIYHNLYTGGATGSDNGGILFDSLIIE